MSKAKKRVIWGIIWLVIWPVWFSAALLTAIGEHSSLGLHFIAAFIPGIIAAGCFVAARQARITSQPVITPLSVTPIERTGRVIKTVSFSIGIVVILFLATSLFEVTDFKDPTLYLWLVVGLAAIAYSFKK